MNPILFHYTFETNCYPVNNLISRNGIWKNERADANSILGKEVKKRRTTRSMPYASSSQKGEYGATVILVRHHHIFWQQSKIYCQKNMA